MTDDLDADMAENVEADTDPEAFDRAFYKAIGRPKQDNATGQTVELRRFGP